ncbi:copper homeostasis protein CutC [Paenibacillus timonensis]|uniref:PF03932 family protein CutC n=1 Tax=Paenibacillus timonensis TaxID=225915 RepID=A0ABW3SGT8_9BACL|nr:copper homeostasis protein CutC [Paenibacillus timonensis]MCH1642023.1 copper homeostasis protein CutC [Paenibacillus timonensis]
MLLEVIATCVEDAVVAEANGADRLELITAITEGGLTPGIGMVQQVVKAVAIPVHVMVRPHSRSFVYGEVDVLTMEAEVRAIADAGAAGIVFGAITAERTIDEAALERILALSGGLNVTFHRAFDELADLPSGLRTLLRYPQVNRVLTSGGPRPAPQAVPAIRELVEIAGGSPLRILAGHGLTLETVSRFVAETGVTEVHFGSAVRIGGDGLAPLDPSKLLRLSRLLHDKNKQKTP